MLSSYKVIKSSSVIQNGNVQINTEYSINGKDTIDDKKELGEKNAKNFIESYEVLARTMLENARRESDEILASAYEDARKLEQEAHEKGLAEGYKEGYDKGLSNGNKYSEEMINNAKNQANKLNQNAQEILFKCNEEYANYLKGKKQEIQALIIEIIESILKKETKNKDSITAMVMDAVEMAYKSKTVIIKCRNEYVEDVKDKVFNWKSQSIYRGEIFVVGDDSLQEGAALILRDNGKIQVSVMDALEKVREIFAANL